MCDSRVSRIAVGFFDGVHLGHRAILKDADVAVTFSAHPRQVVAPASVPPLILSPEERFRRIREAGVDFVEVVEFDEKFASMEPVQFLEFLSSVAYIRCSSKTFEVRCGPDWRFGKGGAGGAELLSELGVKVTVVPFAEYKGEKISSTRIRTSIESGRMEEAAEMLGCEFSVSGEIFRGKGEGASLGFPTVNIRPLSLPLMRMVMPPRGVYAVTVSGEKAIANFGVAPTFAARGWTENVWEIHFLSGLPRLPLDEGSKIRFSILKFIRPERAFSSLDELRCQIAADCKEINK